MFTDICCPGGQFEQPLLQDLRLCGDVGDLLQVEVWLAAAAVDDILVCVALVGQCVARIGQSGSVLPGSGSVALGFRGV